MSNRSLQCPTCKAVISAHETSVRKGCGVLSWTSCTDLEAVKALVLENLRRSKLPHPSVQAFCTWAVQGDAFGPTLEQQRAHCTV
jgi:hypothetical protein